MKQLFLKKIKFYLLLKIVTVYFNEKILVTGSTGQLGSELSVLVSSYAQYEWIFADRTQITLDNLELLQSQLNRIKPDIILNCGAYTAVDKAESEKNGFCN